MGAELWQCPAVWPVKVEGPERAPSAAAGAGVGCFASVVMVVAGVVRRRLPP